MRVYSVMPQTIRANSIKRNDKVESNNQTMPVAMSVPPPRTMPGIMVSFTGNEQKNIREFASYGSENKRYGYDVGGLGVVTKEAASSWRLHEQADVRDFSPYHSYDNADGGIKAVKVKKTKDGKFVTTYKQDEFYHALPNESLDDLIKREKIKLENGEKLAFVVQKKPNDKGMSNVIILEDTDIRGTVTRPSTSSILNEEVIPYRIFRAVSVPDTVDETIENYKQSILKELQKPFKEKYNNELHEKYKEELAEAEKKDIAATELAKKEAEIIKKQRPNLAYEVEDFHDERNKIEEKIKKEIDDLIKGDKELKKQFEEKLKDVEVQKYIDNIKANAAPEKAERNSAYFIHTEGLARFEAPYGNDKAYYATSAKIKINGKLQEISTTLSYADNNRAFIDALPKLNTEKHGNFNPTNIWLHDRPGFMAMNYIADESHFGNKYWDGVKADGRFHNPGRDYQGAESNPFEFFRMVARKEDIDTLKKHKQVEKLQKIEANWANATKEEKSFVYQIMRPFMANFTDDYVDSANDIRTFNISMTPIAGTKINSQNMTCGTVSVNYGKEMKSLATPDIAQFLTTKLAEVKTIDITNGSTPANLRLDDPGANFCRGNHINGLTKLKSGFTTYKYKPVYDSNGKLISDNIEEVIKAKKANLKWLLDALGNAYDKGGVNGITQMFFTPGQISQDNASVIGHLSKYQEGDMLMMGWGRPDPQKGYPSTFQAFLDFLKDPNVDKEVKKHTKLIVGAGVWEDDARDYKWVKDIIRQIEELDGGIYKGNACYVNGFFPNRLVGCATYSIFTSRFEPCGITPLESFAAGTPVMSTKTGGAPDFIVATRGYLTQHAYLRSVEDLKIDPAKLAGKTGQELGNAIDSERMFSNAAEVKELIMSATSDYGIKAEEGKLSKYAEMVRDSLQQKMDWHENGAYNGGKSANERYMTEVFEVDKGMNGRNFNKLKRLVGEFGIAVEDGAKKIRNKWTKIIIGAGIGIAAAGTAAYAYMKRDNKKDNKTPSTEPAPAQTASAENKPKVDKVA